MAHNVMLYSLYQMQTDLLQPLRQMARIGGVTARLAKSSDYVPSMVRHLEAACTLLSETGLTHSRPEFGIDSILVGANRVAVVEEQCYETAFGALLHFRKDTDNEQSRVLVVAPMSGHFATLLRNTVETLLPNHDVYITDWKNAREIPPSAGRFGFDEYIDHLIDFMEAIGEGAHMIAVCQPAVAALAATAIMAEAGNSAQPRSLTLMAGPIDTRINPTRVNELAKSKSIEWFEKTLVVPVPWRYKGASRRVYPGFLQLAAFISMNAGRHINAHFRQFRAVVCGDTVGVEQHRAFYGEYNAVMDLPAEFFLETVQRVFQEHDLPQRRLRWHGHLIRPEAIRQTAILSIEGERDDICSAGQTMAALGMCTGVQQKHHHLQTGVGHYGVFSGSRWQREIYPKVRRMIEIADRHL